jgi:hypothetical protein
MNPMNGAESLIRTLVSVEVRVCFTNPGTSEMHLVAALGPGGGNESVGFCWESCTVIAVPQGPSFSQARLSEPFRLELLAFREPAKSAKAVCTERGFVWHDQPIPQR